jgi:hypothetical protein
MSDVTETWWEAGGIFWLAPGTNSFSARCQKLEEHLRLDLCTAELFVCKFLSRLLRVRLFAKGAVVT